jgi:hypothetical protein
VSEAFGSIAIIANPWYRHFFADLGAELRQRYGAALHIYGASEATNQLYRDADRRGAFASYAVAPSSVTYTLRTDIDAAEAEAKARHFERKYGVTYNSLLVPDRHFGRGYAPGGYYHPRSVQSEYGTLLDAIYDLNRQFEFWEREFETKRIRMVMEVNFPLLATVARHYGALIRNPTPSRHKNLYYWTSDEFGYCEMVADVYASRQSLAEETLAGAPFQGRMFNNEARQRFGLRGVLGTILGYTRDHVVWRLTGYFKAHVYLYRDQVALAWRRRRAYRFLTGSRMRSLESLRGKPFVFYGLHVEPEIWFQSRSPEYFYQLSAIISLSRDLPVGVVLAVKEHLPAVGRRPDLFYEQILALKNVVMLNVEEPGQEIARQATAVATICGTIGQEAAVIGRRVVAFGRHNLYNILAHVRVVRAEEDLRPALEWALSAADGDRTAAKAGARFLAAVTAVSFDMKKFTARTLLGYDRESVEQALAKLADSVAQRPAAALAATTATSSEGVR